MGILLSDRPRVAPRLVGSLPSAMFSMVLVAGVLSIPSAHADLTDFAFSEPEVIDLPEDFAPSCIDLSDHDGDGDLDAVVTGRNLESVILVLEGEPGGVFSTMTQKDAPDQTDWAVTEDIDGDGDLDIVIAVRTTEGLVAIYNGEPDGSFAEEPRLLSVGREIRNVAVADIDSNGTLDLVCLGHVSEDITVLLGDGSGEFQIADQIRLAPWKNGFVYPQSATVLDINGDENLDLVSVSIGARSVHIARGTGGGTLESPKAWIAPDVNGGAGGCAYVSIGDFDSDGLYEFIAPQTTWGQQWVVLFELDETGGITSATPLMASPWGVSWISDVADFDSDGDMDLCVGHALPGVVVFMENVTELGGQTTFSDPQWFFIGDFIRYTRAVDIDLDGDQDLIALDFTGDSILIFRNELNEGFLAEEEPKRTAQWSQQQMNAPVGWQELDGSELARRLSDMSAAQVRELSQRMRTEKPEAE